MKNILVNLHFKWRKPRKIIEAIHNFYFNQPVGSFLLTHQVCCPHLTGIRTWPEYLQCILFLKMMCIISVSLFFFLHVLILIPLIFCCYVTSFSKEDILKNSLQINSTSWASEDTQQLFVLTFPKISSTSKHVLKKFYLAFNIICLVGSSSFLFRSKTESLHLVGEKSSENTMFMIQMTLRKSVRSQK